MVFSHKGVNMAAVKCPTARLQGALLKNAISLVQADPSVSSATFAAAHLLCHRARLKIAAISRSGPVRGLLSVR